ncbi:hypothetical protein ACR77J_12920 [Tissierella praeacuta]|uniref:hypothetical protein n=2 Tax=Tissierella praeacuta TaxID=43131 RepID=UPI0013564298|nr:hypothetical protein [Tissierella praeacuta]
MDMLLIKCYNQHNKTLMGRYYSSIEMVELETMKMDFEVTKNYNVDCIVNEVIQY